MRRSFEHFTIQKGIAYETDATTKAVEDFFKTFLLRPHGLFEAQISPKPSAS